MIIDQHTINTLRTLAHQCAEAEQHAGVEPATLLALLAGYEESGALAADRTDLIQELVPCQNVLHQLAHAGQCTPEYANDARVVLQRITGGNPPTFDDHRPTTTSLDLLKLEAAKAAMLEFADECKTNHQIGETFGMTISGPTECSSAPRCLRAARLVFLDAARITQGRIETTSEQSH
jgi:hypothetical protein